jgi:4-hydroxy-tetrahydrodipicolinate synthase
MAELKRLEGIMPALATPLNEDETLDEAALRQLLRWVLDGGVHGVVVLGSAGEFTALADEQKRRTIEIVVSEVAGQVPVIAGTGEPGTRRALEMTRMAAKLGVDAAMVVPPYYHPLNQAAVLKHYRSLAAESKLPIILYNIPGCTKVALDLEVVDELSEEEGIIGIKDSSGSFGYFQTLVERVKSDIFCVITGSDHLLFASMIVGGDGSIGPGANIAPQWFVGLWEAVRDARLDEAWALERRIMSLSGVYRYGGFHAGLKAALAVLGICQPVVTSPLCALTDDQMKTVEAKLREVQLL